MRKWKLRRAPQQKQKLRPRRLQKAGAEAEAEVEAEEEPLAEGTVDAEAGNDGTSELRDVMAEEVACGANGTTQLAPSRRYTREEAGSERVALPYEVLVVWVTGGRGCWAPLV